MHPPPCCTGHASNTRHLAALGQQPSRVPSGPMPSPSASLYLAYRAAALSALGTCSRDTESVQHDNKMNTCCCTGYLCLDFNSRFAEHCSRRSCADC